MEWKDTVKAGQEFGYEQGVVVANIANAENLRQMRKAGIKEVMELVVYTDTLGEMQVVEFLRMSKEGRAKLKEWEVK